MIKKWFLSSRVVKYDALFRARSRARSRPLYSPLGVQTLPPAPSGDARFNRGLPLTGLPDPDPPRSPLRAGDEPDEPDADAAAAADSSASPPRASRASRASRRASSAAPRAAAPNVSGRSAALAPSFTEPIFMSAVGIFCPTGQDESGRRSEAAALFFSSFSDASRPPSKAPPASGDSAGDFPPRCCCCCCCFCCFWFHFASSAWTTATNSESDPALDVRLTALSRVSRPSALPADE